jgi:hypothetical protein
MNIVLRPAGPSLDVDTCMTWIRPDLLSQTWHAGEHDALKRVLQTNGFTLGLVLEAMKKHPSGATPRSRE